MTDTIIILCAIIALLIAGFAAYLIWAQKKFTELEAQGKTQPASGNGGPLQLAAYERLTLFAERNKLDNLVNRLYSPQLSGSQMQQTLTAAIREEYEHNITQQLYVKPEIWDALTKMKDQNMYIINQIGALLPPEATALDLNKRILEYTLNNPDATLNKLVLEAMQFEARRLMG